LEFLLALEDQVAVRWTGVLSEKRLHLTTNLEGGEEHREEVSLHDCSTGLFAFVLIFLLKNLVSLDSGVANGARSLPETPRSRLGDNLRQDFGRVGEVDQVEDDDRQEWYV
jgi:hypothetical protein